MHKTGGKGQGKERSRDPFSLAGSRLTTEQIFLIPYGSMYVLGFPDESLAVMLHSTAFGASLSD